MVINEALENHEFVIDSHRGAFKNGLLENTIPAFKEAITEGANMLECDIRFTKDENIVLLHDSQVDRILKYATKVPDENEFNEKPIGSVSTHTLDYLKAMAFPNSAQILTLEEFLQFLTEQKVGAQIELKEFNFNEEIIKIIETMNVDHGSLKTPIVFSSFNPFAILKLRKMMKNQGIPIHDNLSGDKGFGLGLQGIRLGGFLGKWVLKRCKKNTIWGFLTHYRNLPPKRIPLAHEMGVKFCPRVPDKEDLIISYINSNVDGFETDNVPFIKKCIEKVGYSYP
ncbi:MAG: glycerophosphodiester phosphodiesterase [Promethearchaeota archaeon]